MPVTFDTYQKLLRYRIPTVELDWSKRDTILYALSVGFGFDPVDRSQLRYVYEPALLAVPSMAAMLCQPYGWFAGSGVGFGLNSVQAGQRVELHGPLPTSGRFRGESRIVGVQDKGPGKGAVLAVERILTDRDSGKRLATLLATSYCRGDGGFGGPVDEFPPPHRLPSTPAQFTVDLPTIPQAALLYRLHGDPTPLHADPDYATRVGFRQPIMHGLCTFGIACHAVLKSMSYPDPAGLQKMEARFKEPAYPGETLRAEVWLSDKLASFRLTVPTRNNAVVLDNGRAEFST